MPSEDRAPHLALHAGIGLASGVPALVYEVVWTREVALLVGGQVEAIAAVLAVFFGGLALGARVLGPRADRARLPLRVYAGLELAAGVLAVATGAGLRALGEHALALPAAARLALSLFRQPQAFPGHTGWISRIGCS